MKEKKFHKVVDAGPAGVFQEDTTDEDATLMVPSLTRQLESVDDRPKYVPRKVDATRYVFDKIRNSKGPAKYNSTNFRSHWDNVFADGEDKGVGGHVN